MTKITGNQGDGDRNEYASRPERNFSPRPARRGRIAEVGASDVDQCLAGFPPCNGLLALAQAHSRDCDLSNVG
jgi:hypothetical protein